MTYSTAKFEVATSYGLGGDTFTRNVMDGRTDRRTDDGPTLTQNSYTLFFLKKKVGIIIANAQQLLDMEDLFGTSAN